jgi:hypothetical protein
MLDFPANRHAVTRCGTNTRGTQCSHVATDLQGHRFGSCQAHLRRKPRMGGAFWFVMSPASMPAHSGSFGRWGYPETVAGLAASVTWKVRL